LVEHWTDHSAVHSVAQKAVHLAEKKVAQKADWRVDLSAVPWVDRKVD
jgi:hypothetical protein